MSAGRKPLTTTVVEMIDANLDQPKIAGAMAQMRVDGVAERQARDTDMFDLGRQVGAIQMANVQTDFLAVARIRLFDEIKESNKYKDLAITGPDGNLATARTLEEFCSIVFGVGYAKMVESSKDLAALGRDGYESANRLGLNRKQLRLIRSLPDAQRTAVAEAIQSESKADVVAIIEDLAAELSQAQADVVEAKAETAARDLVIADKNNAADKLRTQLKRIQAAPPDEQLLMLQKEATSLMNDALGCVRGQIRNALIALKNHSDDDNSLFMAGLVGQLQGDLSALREEFNLPDISSAADAEAAAEVAQWGTPASQ